MPDVDVPERLTAVFQDVFNDDDLQVFRSTTAEDVPGWDSLAHMRLILSVEQAYKIRLPSTKVGNLKNVGDLADLIEAVQRR